MSSLVKWHEEDHQSCEPRDDEGDRDPGSEKVWREDVVREVHWQRDEDNENEAQALHA